jgi:hypothetical protein
MDDDATASFVEDHAKKPLPTPHSPGSSDSSDSSEEEDDDEYNERYNERVRDFCEGVVVAVGKAAPPILKSAIRAFDIEKKVREQHAGDTIPFEVHLGYGEDVTLLDGDGKRFHLSCPGESGASVEEDLYAYFEQRFPEKVHAWHCTGMGDGGRHMSQLVENMCVEIVVVVRREGKEIEIQTPTVTFTSEDEFARDCMDDEERDERDERREERRRLKEKIKRKFVRRARRAAKRARPSPKPEVVVDQRGATIGELTRSQRSVLQHGCYSCDPCSAGTCADCVALREKGLLEWLLE